MITVSSCDTNLIDSCKQVCFPTTSNAIAWLLVLVPLSCLIKWIYIKSAQVPAQVTRIDLTVQQWRNQGVHGWALRPPMAVILREISSWGEIFAKLGGN